MIHNNNFLGIRNANNILKSFQQDTQILPSLDELRKGVDEEDDLEKGGEGSKGGKVIGHTKSGKPIYDTGRHHSYANFTYQDHFDASSVHADMGEHLYAGRSEKYKHIYNNHETTGNDKFTLSNKHVGLSDYHNKVGTKLKRSQKK